MPLPANVSEATALDTNNDGQLSPLDSPFEAYYPGDEYVDWVGLSVYYKGPNSQNINVAQPSGYCYGALRNHNPNNGVDTVDPWYENYCVGRNKACMVGLYRSLSSLSGRFYDSEAGHRADFAFLLPPHRLQFAESGPAYHDMIFGDQGISDAALKLAWVEDCLVRILPPSS